MATYKMKRDIRKMFKWAIKQMFESNEYAGRINFDELRRELWYAWDELYEDGFLADIEDYEPSN